MSEEAQIAEIIGYQDEKCGENWEILEVGPGSVLSGLWRDSGFAEHISCTALNTLDSFVRN